MAALMMCFLSLSLMSAISAAPTANSEGGGESKAQKIARLKLQVQKLQTLLEQINTDELKSTPAAIATTVSSPKDKKQDGRHDMSRERNHVVGVIQSLTEEDIRVLEDLRDALVDLKERQKAQRLQSNSRQRYAEKFKDLDGFYRSIEKDNNVNIGKKQHSGFQRSDIPKKRPAYRDRADKALKSYKDGLKTDTRTVNGEGHFEAFSHSDSDRNRKIKTIELRLLDDLRQGLKQGITLEDLIADLDKMKEKEKRKRTLVLNEEAELEKLRKDLHK